MTVISNTQIETSGGSRKFPREVRQLPKMLLFFNFFEEICMKMKEFGPQGALVPGAPLDPPMETFISRGCCIKIRVAISVCLVQFTDSWILRSRNGKFQVELMGLSS